MIDGHLPPVGLTRYLLLLSVAVVAAVSVGCRDAAGGNARADTGAGAFHDSIRVEGIQRTFRIYVPRSLPAAGSSPLVIAMHGGLGTADLFAWSSRFDEAAEDYGFIVVYPDGIGRTWNGGRCCGLAVRQEVNDVAFISALIDHLLGRYPIDANRVFATGHSNGAIMAFRLACDLADRIAAVAPVAGSLELETCEASRPVAVLAIHGDADESHPIGGGVGRNSIAGVFFYSLASSMEKLRGVNGCGPYPETSVDGDTTTTTWSCAPGGETVAKVLHGGSHAWPGGDRSQFQPGLLGEPSQALNATEEISRFFSAHGRP